VNSIGDFTKAIEEAKGKETLLLLARRGTFSAFYALKRLDKAPALANVNFPFPCGDRGGGGECSFVSIVPASDPQPLVLF